MSPRPARGPMMESVLRRLSDDDVVTGDNHMRETLLPAATSPIRILDDDGGAGVWSPPAPRGRKATMVILDEVVESVHEGMGFRWMTAEDIRFIWPNRGGNYIHGRGMQGRWIRALYARLEPHGA